MYVYKFLNFLPHIFGGFPVTMAFSSQAYRIYEAGR